MGTLVFQANLGGAVNLIGPNTASTVNFTLPSADGTSGQALVTNGSGTLSFSTFTSGAAGSNTQVQFNSSGAFAGSANLTFDGTTLTSNALTVTNATTLSAGTANGVAYLNGSKVVTTGSALTFDGTVLNVGSATFPSGRIRLKQADDTTKQKGLLIETAADDSLLAIGYNSGAFTYNATYNSTGSYQPQAWWVSGSEQMRLTSTGLGIGTSSPAVRLNVTDSADGGNSGTIRLGSDATYYAQHQFRYNSSEYRFGTYGAGQFMSMYTAGSERARITSGGQLLVGASSSDLTAPTACFIGTSGIAVQYGASTGTYCQITPGVANGVVDIKADARSGSFPPLTFTTSSTERARIDTSGNLLVGTTSQAGRITVNGSTADSTANALSIRDSAASSLLAVRNDGRIATGGSLSPYNNTTASAANQYVDASGIFYRSTSSLKYKTNVQDAVHGLAEVMQLRPVTYKGKSEADIGKTFGGLIAEEVHAAGLTEFVQYAEDGSPDALAYGNMVSLCIKAIQEQQALITQLTERITALEAR